MSNPTRNQRLSQRNRLLGQGEGSRLLQAKIRLFENLLCAVALVAVFAINAPARAAECLEDSPTVQAGKDPYAPIHVRDLTPEEYNRILTLFKSLQGQWKGTAREFFCLDLNDPTAKKSEDFTVKADVTVDYFGNFLLEMTLYSQKQNATHSELMRFYLDQKRLRINTNSNAGDVELLGLSEQSIALLYRLLLQNDNGKGSTRKEFFVELTASDQTFAIRQRIYSQGRLSYEKDWRFIRP
jgi:hypothetical protein